MHCLKLPCLLTSMAVGVDVEAPGCGFRVLSEGLMDGPYSCPGLRRHTCLGTLLGTTSGRHLPCPTLRPSSRGPGWHWCCPFPHTGPVPWPTVCSPVVMAASWAAHFHSEFLPLNGVAGQSCLQMTRRPGGLSPSSRLQGHPGYGGGQPGPSSWQCDPSEPPLQAWDTEVDA